MSEKQGHKRGSGKPIGFRRKTKKPKVKKNQSSLKNYLANKKSAGHVPALFNFILIIRNC